MDHLYPSRFRVERIQMQHIDGEVITDWAQATSDDPAENDMLQYLPGRLDMTFSRPGLDQPQVVETGVQQDRVGILFTDPYAPLKSGDRIVAIPNDDGVIVVPGTFDVGVVPEAAVDFDSRHHIEVQVKENVQNVDSSLEAPE